MDETMLGLTKDTRLLAGSFERHNTRESISASALKMQRLSCSELDVAALQIPQSCHTTTVKTALPTGSAVATLTEGSGLATARLCPFPNLFHH